MKQKNTERLYIASYFDENVSGQIADALARKNYDALTAKQAGMLGKSDEEQLDFAVAEQRTIITHDRQDYLKLHLRHLTQGKHHSGIIILNQRKEVGQMISGLLDLFEHTTADEIENQLRYV